MADDALTLTDLEFLSNAILDYGKDFENPAGSLYGFVMRKEFGEEATVRAANAIVRTMLEEDPALPAKLLAQMRKDHERRKGQVRALGDAIQRTSKMLEEISPDG